MLLLSLLAIPVVTAEFLGPLYPYPKDISSDHSLVASVWKERIVGELNAYLANGSYVAGITGTGMENLTFSAGLFSTLDKGARTLQYHHTALEVANALIGTNKVDADSIYGLASMTKLFTVFAGMLTLTNEEWHRPLSQVFPELSPASHNVTKGIRYSAYDDISAWSSATHMAGIPYWVLPNYDLLTELAAASKSPTVLGFPSLNISALGPCWNVAPNSESPFCAPSDFLTVAASQYPQFEPWTSPAYSNAGMFLLGLAIGAMKNTTLEAVWQDKVFGPLGLRSTSANPSTDPAKTARGVIGAVPEAWFVNSSYAAASGGLKSSLNDITAFATAILNSSLLSPATTRRWMTPAALLPSFDYAVGGPWEIIRYSNPTTGRITDIYSKSGDAGPNGGVIALIPEYKVGFNVLCQAQNATIKTPPMLSVIDHIVHHLMPALEAQAAYEAAAVFAGTYRASDVNSSIVISLGGSTVQNAVGGLSISRWTSNGTNMLTNPAMAIDSQRPKLLPTIQDVDSGKTAFYVTSNEQTTTYRATGKGPWAGWYEANFDWVGISAAAYGGVAVKELVFHIGPDGRACKVTSPALRVDMKRV